MLTGCSAFEAPEIADCEAGLLRTLKAPSTYKRIKASSTDLSGIGKRQQSVRLEYDAANGFGVPIRGDVICVYALRSDGKVDLGSAQRIYPDGIQYSGSMTDPLVAPAPVEKHAPRANKAAPTIDEAENEGEPMGGPYPDDEPVAANRCFDDYCPCEEDGAPDRVLCRNMKAGLPVDDQMMAAGAAFRDSRRELKRLEAENGPVSAPPPTANPLEKAVKDTPIPEGHDHDPAVPADTK